MIWDFQKNTDPSLTIGEIEAEYGVSGDLVANYMVLHMGNMPTSVNSRGFVEMRQQAMQGIRHQGMTQGLNFMMQGHSAFGNYTTFTFDESGRYSISPYLVMLFLILSKSLILIIYPRIFGVRTLHTLEVQV